jgi:hypothetical protein
VFGVWIVANGRMIIQSAVTKITIRMVIRENETMMHGEEQILST